MRSLLGPKLEAVPFRSDSSGNPVVTMDQAIFSTFRQAPGQVQIFNEYLDQARITTDQSYERGLVALLQGKYKDRKFDLIIALGLPALQMLNKNGETLYPGVPVVFGGTARRNDEALNLGANATGVTRFEWRPTLDLPLKLLPDTRRVVVVAGDSDFDRRYVAEARQELSVAEVGAGR